MEQLFVSIYIGHMAFTGNTDEIQSEVLFASKYAQWLITSKGDSWKHF